MRKFYFLFFLFFFNSNFSFSQKEVYNYARKIVDTMTSESMHGRGYVNDGDKIAANYIKTEFQKFGLKSFTENYYQHFNFDINTFPGAMKVKIGKQELIPGKDFIIKYSFQPDFKTKKRIHYRNKKKHDISLNRNDFFISDTLGDELLKYPLSSFDDFPRFSATIVDKLTWGFENLDYKWILKNNYEGILLLIQRGAIEGYPQKISFNIQSKFIPNYQSQNVIGYIEGSTYPDSFIVFSAHYDHLGQMGRDVYFPGANDNASGCAMLLNLAKHYSKPENKPKCSIAFIAFGAEEVGLLGSKFYTEHPLFPLNKIKFVFNMDIMGTGEEGITVVNGAIYKNEFEKLKQINSENNFIKDVKPRGKAANSDHYFFSEKGVKAFFIYTMGGIKAYHDIYDRPETLPLSEFENLFKLITNFSAYLQN